MFLPELLPVRWQVGFISVLMLVSPLLSILLLWLMKILVDDVLVGGDIALLNTIMVCYAAVVATKLLIDYVRTRIAAA